MLSQGTFVLGGAASGKSVWAETLLNDQTLPKIYLATGRILDAEVQVRVDVHRARRDAGWRTIEAPLDPGAALRSLPADCAVLIDCATMWLTNHILDDGDLKMAQADLLDGLRTCAAPWVIVSNEVGQGIVPDNRLGRRFREAQGRLNIALAAQADLVVQVTAGLPLILKGALQ